MKYSIAAFLAFVFVIFQHFQVASIATYPVTIGLFAGILMILIVSTRSSIVPITVTWSVIVGLGALSALVAPNYNDGTEFGQTLLLILLSSAVVVSGFYGRATDFVRSAQFAKALFWALTVIVTLSMLQVVTGSLGSIALFNPFGANQYLYQYQPYLQFVAVPRAQGFYLEPSYDAFVIGTLTVCLLALGRNKIAASILCFLGLLACQSATGLLLFAAIAILIAVRAQPRVGVVVFVLLAALVWLAGPSLTGRLESLGAASSSANYRLVAPLEVMNTVLTAHPLGFPFGSIADVMASYGLQNGSTIGSSLDTGFYVIIFYFGWIGLFALVCWMVATAMYALSRSRSGTGLVRIIPLWLFSCMFFSGGIVLPEFAISVWLAISCMPLASETIGKLGLDRKTGTYTSPQHRDSYVQ